MRTGDEEWEPKAAVVREICSISTVFASCSHLPSNVRKPAFVDWYLILSVEEDSGLDVIRRRYRQLALQIHPDKNWHPKAEVAFKLLSEAHEWLSDKSKRKAFDCSRRSRFCRECHLKFERSKAPQSKQRGVLRSFREVQNRLKEEVRVIESCLIRANDGPVGKEESPLFNPPDRLLFPGYPHTRARVLAGRQPEKNYWHFRRSTTPADQWRRFGCESPVYQNSPAGCRS